MGVKTIPPLIGVPLDVASPLSSPHRPFPSFSFSSQGGVLMDFGDAGYLEATDKILTLVF